MGVPCPIDVCDHVRNFKTQSPFKAHLIKMCKVDQGRLNDSSGREYKKRFLAGKCDFCSNDTVFSVEEKYRSYSLNDWYKMSEEEADAIVETRLFGWNAISTVNIYDVFKLEQAKPCLFR